MKFAVLSLLCFSAVNTLGFDFNKSMKVFNYAAAAYCNTDLLTLWQCGEACSSSYGVTTFTKIIDEDKSTFGFVAYNAKTDEAVVSFRGTVNIQNWVTDINFFQMPFPYASNGA